MAAKVRFRNFIKSFMAMRFLFFSFLIFSVMACTMKNRSVNAGKNTFDLQGHRGCRGLMPENTIPAMIKALQLGVTTLEMDVVISKDRQVVVSHEPFMSWEIATSPEGTIPTFQNQKSFNLYKMNYSEIVKWDVGSRPHLRFPSKVKMKIHKPLLKDLIDSVELFIRNNKMSTVNYNIETKSSPSTDGIYHPAPEEFVELLMEIIKDKKLLKRVTIQSFDERTLQVVHQKFRAVKTALLVEANDKKTVEQQIELLGFTPTVYSPEFQLVNAELVEQCRKQKMLLIPWTVNDKKQINDLIAMGVNGIITDYPDLIMKN